METNFEIIAKTLLSRATHTMVYGLDTRQVDQVDVIRLINALQRINAPFPEAEPRITWTILPTFGCALAVLPDTTNVVAINLGKKIKIKTQVAPSENGDLQIQWRDLPENLTVEVKLKSATNIFGLCHLWSPDHCRLVTYSENAWWTLALPNQHADDRICVGHIEPESWMPFSSRQAIAENWSQILRGNTWGKDLMPRSNVGPVLDAEMTGAVEPLRAVCAQAKAWLATFPQNLPIMEV